LGVAAGVLIAGGAQAGDNWRFPVGLSYIDGFSDVVSYYEDTYHADSGGFVPIGLSFTPYYQCNHGSRMGVDVGPAGVVMVTGGAEDRFFWNLPLAFTYGFTFMPSRSVAPYVRTGVKYNIAGGDDVQDSKAGLFVATGVEFLRHKICGVGVEVGYDDSEVTLGSDDWRGRSVDRTVKPGGVIVSLRAVF
jgi:hypothetical protein